MTLSRICGITALVLELIEVAAFFIRLKKRGSAKPATERSKIFWVRLILIYVCVLAIPVICLFIEFGTIGDLVLCACAVFALEIVNREFLLPKDDSESGGA